VGVGGVLDFCAARKHVSMYRIWSSMPKVRLLRSLIFSESSLKEDDRVGPIMVHLGMIVWVGEVCLTTLGNVPASPYWVLVCWIVVEV